MKNIEIPYPKERGAKYRALEILPGLLSWSLLLLPIVLSFVSVTLTAIFVIFYILVWFFKAIALNIRVLQGYKIMKRHEKLDWHALIKDLAHPASAITSPASTDKWHSKNLVRLFEAGESRDINDYFHVIIIALYKEPREVIEPTIQNVLKSHYDMNKVAVFVAYEERGGEATKTMITQLAKDYKNSFYHFEAVEHPKDIEGEVIGKGGNITFTGRRVKDFLDEKKIPYVNTILTTLDSDNRPHANYLASLTYFYMACPDPVTTSFQPIPMFLNNIWDAPAPMRVIAAGNSFWMIVQALRPHMLRNFASHAQSMQALVDTDFWSTRTIVEDGHQFWRTYFRYDGRHDVHPLFVPVYQDAVLAGSYTTTLKAQFIQMRRWAWGASDIAYVISKGFSKKSKVPKADLFFKITRLIEGHVSWATAPLLILLAPLSLFYLNPDARTSLVANQLPVIASRIQTAALVGIVATLYLSVVTLPPRPERYKRRKHAFMFLQWVLLPFTTIFYSSFAAITSQTRLMFGKYLGKFDFTEKVVKK